MKSLSACCSIALRFSFWIGVAAILFSGCLPARATTAVPLADWTNIDIGTVGVAGSGSYNSTTDAYTMTGAGSDIYGTADSCHFSYIPLNGDGYVIARVQSLTNTSTSAKAGVMIRETLLSNSKNAMMMVTPGVGVGTRYRSTVGGTTTSTMVTGVTAPQWLKLVRSGSVFESYYSADGVTWILGQRIAISMATEAYVGLFACSRSTTALTTAVIDQVLVDSLPVLPWPWVENTVGTPTDAGVALFDGSYVLANLGADIASTADKMKFVSQPLAGDGTLTIKVSSLTSGTTAPRFGLMMRDSLQPGAANVLIGMTTPQDLVFQSRRSPGATTASRATAVTLSYPTWLRLARSGNTFTASYSSNGTSWTQQGVETIEMPPVIQVGVAYSNRSTTVWGMGVGDALSLVTPADADGNGLPDAWGIAYFGATGIALNADPDSDNLTNYQEWELGNNPHDFNALGQHPVVEIVSGNSQQTPVGTDLPQPLVVRVKDSLSSSPASGVPVTFLVTSGAAQVGASSAWQSSLTVVTDENGLAQTPVHFSTRAGASTVQATVGGGQQAGVVTFTLKALAGEAPLLLDPVDLGVPVLPGRADYSSGAFTLGSQGTAISGAADTGYFAFGDFTGDGYILAKVASFDSTDTWGRAGVMMRQSTNADAPYAAVFMTPGAGAVFQYRATAGGATTISRVAGFTAPCWVLLRRSGDSFYGLFSTDGQVWQSISSAGAVVMPATIRAGLAISAADTVYRNAVLTDLRLSPPSQSPWRVADIGTVNTAAIDDYTENSILVRGSGTGIGSTADKFRYVYQAIPADGRIIVHVASQLADQTTAKSGIMLRSGIGSDARNLLLATVPATGVMVQKRLTDGAYGIVGATQAGAAPRWLKFEKLGFQVDSYTSANGTDWSLVSTDTMDFGAGALIGLAANSAVTTAHTQSLFDHIQVDAFSGARGWNASYYQGAEFGTLHSSRRDSTLDFSWTAGVTPTGVPAGAYSARWQGDLVPAYTETYTFTTLSQGGARVTVDGHSVIDNWVQHGAVENSGSLVLQAGVPVRIVIDYANANVAAAGRIQLRWSSASQIDEVVPTDALRPVDGDMDGIPDTWEIAHGLNPLDPLDATLDPDHDGFTNLLEYQQGSSPSQPDDRVAGSVVMEKWLGILGTTVADLTNSPRFLAAPDERSIITSLDTLPSQTNYYGARIRGYLVAPSAGDYQFWVAGNDNVELWLSATDSPFERTKIAWTTVSTAVHAFDVNPEQHSATVRLQAGQYYYFEVLYKNFAGDDHLSVAWQRPGMQREIISGQYLASYMPTPEDMDGNGLPDVWEMAYWGHTGVNPFADQDGDGLSNLAEYQNNVDPTKTDTDGDGISDADELALYGTDPRVVDIGQFTPGFSWMGSQFTRVTGNWAMSGSRLALSDARGLAVKSFDVAAAGVFQINVTVVPSGLYDRLADTDVVVSIDGCLLRRATLKALGSTQATVRCLSMWLNAGTHRVEILLDGHFIDNHLAIDTVTANAATGADVDGNGVPDWVDQQLASRSATQKFPAVSEVSPAYLEGISPYPQLVRSGGLVAAAAPDCHWFLRVPLNAEGATPVSLSLENGGIVKNQDVTWTATRVLEGGSRSLVPGASLKISGLTETEETAGAVFSLTVDGVSQGTSLTAPVVVSFTQPGTHSVNVTTLRDGQSVAHTLAVTVQNSAVEIDPLLASGATRTWLPGNTTGTVVFDANLNVLPGQTGGGFTLFAQAVGDFPVALRSEEGEYLNSTYARVRNVYTGAQSKIFTEETLPDGTQIVAMYIVAGDMTDRESITLKIFAGSVVFDDGKTTKTFRKADFNEVGLGIVRFVKPSWVDHAACHTTTVYDAAVVVGTSIR